MYFDNPPPFHEVPPFGSVDPSAPPSLASGALGNSTYSARLSPALSLNVWTDGSLVETKRLINKDPFQDSDGKHSSAPRGDVRCLTSQARRRLSATVAKLRRDAPCHFITLTYPGHSENWSPKLSEFGPPVPLPGPRQSKQELRAFFKWIHRQFPAFSAVWKLEPQERGVPHFHLLAYGLPDDVAVMDSLRKRWHLQVGRGQDAHLDRGFDADFLGTDADKARAYVSKYVAKGDALLLNSDHGPHAGRSPGRFWGLEFRQSLPLSDFIEMQIPPEFAAVAIRTLRRLHTAKIRHSYRKRVGKHWHWLGDFPPAPDKLKLLRSCAHNAHMRTKKSYADRGSHHSGLTPYITNYPTMRDPFKHVPLLRNNFTKDPREFVSRLLDAVTVTATHSPPDKLAGPLGPLP